MSASQPKDQRAEIKTAVPGPQSRALRAREDAHMAPGLQGYAVSAGIVVDEGRGSAVTDVDGNTFLDFIGGIGVNALGEYGLHDRLGLHYFLARAIVAVAVSLLWNFPMHRYFVFRSTSKGAA